MRNWCRGVGVGVGVGAWAGAELSSAWDGRGVGWGASFSCAGHEVISQEHVESCGDRGNGPSMSGTNVRRSHQSRIAEN